MKAACAIYNSTQALVQSRAEGLTVCLNLVSAMAYADLCDNDIYQRPKQQAHLGLLDLPIDILSQIISHTGHTNDLCALALTHSALHSLATPCIYSRFDIVWPEVLPTTESRVGVDALTYGLSTLVMSHEVFGETQNTHCAACKCCLGQEKARTALRSSRLPVNVRRGNNFASYTRKFSLGNGPSDWTQEYSISREGGKMLGTLVALAVGRMRSLESFVWDMPTGVLRDVWLALGSLANRHGSDCRLEKVWIRWHDNRDVALLPRVDRQSTIPSLLHGSVSSLFQIPPYPTVEFPTFSALPPLKNITSLDMDELSYAEELSVLLARSLDCVRELRLGVAVYAQHDLIFRPIDDRTVVPPEFRSCQPQTNPGGILGVLVSQFCQPFKLSTGTATSPLHGTKTPHSTPVFTEARSMAELKPHESPDMNIEELESLLAAQTLHDDQHGLGIGGQALRKSAPPVLNSAEYSGSATVHSHGHDIAGTQKMKLKLTTFELERIYLSIPVLSRAIDWTRLESLVLLGCTNHEELWSALRRQFTPSSRKSTPINETTTSRLRATTSSYGLVEQSGYKLKIKRLHTDTVSKSLLDFLRHTLAPDTLEWLFLQRTASYRTSSSLSIDDITRCIRRHRGSLRKLLIDSEYRNMPRFDRERRDGAQDTSWYDWMLNDDLISLIASPRMHLRELSMSIDHRNMHSFLQRLPNATSLRSLHIAHIASHPNGPRYDRKDIATSVLNIIAVRPEIELCYLGIDKKCYEIVEYTSKYARPPSPSRPVFLPPDEPAIHHNDGPYTLHPPTIHHAMVEEASDDDDDGGAAHHLHHVLAEDLSEEEFDHDDANSQISSRSRSHAGDTDNEDEHDHDQPAFKLREILFYDDKISIFKARHGKL